MSFSEKILPWLSIRFFPVLLAVSVYGFTISLLFWRGTYELSLYVAAFAVMGLVVVRWLAGHQDLADPSDGPAPQALATEGKGTGDSPLPCGEERVRERGLPTPRLFPDRSFLIFFAIVLMLVVQGMMTAGSRITGDFHGFLLWSVLMVYAVGLLPERLGGRFRISHRWLGAVVVAASVPVQIVAYFHSVDNAEAALMVELSRIVEITHANVYADVDGFLALVEIAKAAAIANAAALFPNIHLLALYSVLTLPILFYFSLQPGNAMRWLFLLALLGDFWLLMKTQSRPGFLALLAGSLAVVPLLSFRLALAALAAAILVPTCTSPGLSDSGRASPSSSSTSPVRNAWPCGGKPWPCCKRIRYPNGYSAMASASSCWITKLIPVSMASRISRFPTTSCWNCFTAMAFSGSFWSWAGTSGSSGC